MAPTSQDPQVPPANVATMVASLKAQVNAARDEFDMAIAFHRTWRPCAHDNALMERMGTSYASNAFLVVRTALQRETLMALARLWDTHRDAVRMKSIGNILADKRVIKVLADASVPDVALTDDTLRGAAPFLRQQMEASKQRRAKEAIALIDAYSSEDELKEALGNLKALRDKVLAHRQVAEPNLPEKTAADEQVDRLMADMTKLIGLLSSIALGTAYNPGETAQIYDSYAEFFWASAKGERTEGHPSYRPTPG